MALPPHRQRRLWHFGNTTLRSPFRLRDGLVALGTSNLPGNLHGKEQESAFAWLLAKHEIVNILRGEKVDVSDMGRKWRSALTKLGFVAPEIDAKHAMPADLAAADTITENGRNLIAADSVPAMQECFLRSLAAYVIPNPAESYAFSTPFSPLRHVLRVMLELESQAGSSRLSIEEMAYVVQTSAPEHGLDNVVAKVLEFRARREAAASKKRYLTAVKEEAASEFGYKRETFNDYADTNFRYLKATGLFQTSGRGIVLFEDKRALIELLVADGAPPATPEAYYRRLFKGAALPTDDVAGGMTVLRDLLTKTAARGIRYQVDQEALTTAAAITTERHRLEGLLQRDEEEAYAKAQVGQWREIAAYMELLATRQATKLGGDEAIRVPRDEAPAYLEWTLWRAFLAINHLRNKPFEARGFKVDQDFLPVGNAPGGGPDLVFEFDDFALVVEVTLMENSRQEAAEGEPVRRHVANLLDSFPGKPVYGLFVANRIDSNTAETFRCGVWYRADDERLALAITPIPLTTFRELFMALFEKGANHPGRIRSLLDACNAPRAGLDAPAWKAAIDKTVRSAVSALPH